ncbi:MAG: D-alanine--D-alanine ligase [Gammaproteobacteria bacterium]|nr:D-alanine--D-alanine ligase [Gammaproteobacteria bacterium]
MNELHQSNLREKYGRVAVLYGGTSAEREVSLRSGKAVLEALLRAGVDAHGIDFQGDLAVLAGYDRAWLALHGRGGEDGTLQGALELMKLPYTGSGVLGSSLGMDKERCKLVFQALGLSTPSWVMVEPAVAEDLAKARAVLAKVGPVVMVKPVLEGSSVGIAKAATPEELMAAVREATRFDSPVMAEHFISGGQSIDGGKVEGKVTGEFTVPILDNKPLPSIHMETPRTFYDYTAKYHSGGTTQYYCPSGLSAEEEAELGTLALAAFKAVGCSGWGRVDLMRDAAGRFYLLEVNTLPGMTETSLVPMAARATGLSFEQLVVKILDSSLEKA